MGSINPKWINAVQNLPYGERQRVTNSSGAEIAKYALVYIDASGTDGNYGKIAAATSLTTNARAANSHGKLGICLYKTIDGARTDIAPWAILRDVNTSGATTVGDPIYLGVALDADGVPTGNWSTTKSTRIVGKVLKKHATEGVVLLDPSTDQASLIVSGTVAMSGGDATVALGAHMAGGIAVATSTATETACRAEIVSGAGNLVLHCGSGTDLVAYIVDARGV